LTQKILHKGNFGLVKTSSILTNNRQPFLKAELALLIIELEVAQQFVLIT
jgi:hypothetical protein